MNSKQYIINDKNLMKEWNWDKNNDIDPSSITKSSGKKVWWICKNCGFEWESRICNRYNGTGCPNCRKRNKTSK